LWSVIDGSPKASTISYFRDFVLSDGHLDINNKVTHRLTAKDGAHADQFQCGIVPGEDDRHGSIMARGTVEPDGAGSGEAAYVPTHRQLDLHWMFLHVHWMFLKVHWMFTECSLEVFTGCSLDVHCMLTECSLDIHWMFTGYSLDVH
jgi:hypothetical protein